MDRTAPSRERGSEAGFTLIEAMVAILILVFGIIAIANLFVVAGSSNTVANHGTAAASMAGERMEALKALRFDTLSAQVSATATGAAAIGDLDSNVNDANGAPMWEEVTVPGVGVIRTRWQLTRTDGRTIFIRVRSQSTGAVTGARTRAEFTVFRTCTHAACPAAT